MKMTVHHIFETLLVLTSFHPPRNHYIPPERQLACPETVPILIEQVYEQPYPGLFTTGYRVRYNGLVSQPCGWDEMLGLIASLTLTGKFHYFDAYDDAYEEKQRIRAIQRRMGPLLDFPQGSTSRHEINWHCVEL